jgi:hypothetical protein
MEKKSTYHTADDIAFVAGSEDDLHNSQNTIEKVFQKYNMKINKKGTKVLVRKRENSGQRPPERREIGTSGIIHLPWRYHYLGLGKHVQHQMSNSAR